MLVVHHAPIERFKSAIVRRILRPEHKGASLAVEPNRFAVIETDTIIDALNVGYDGCGADAVVLLVCTGQAYRQKTTLPAFCDDAVEHFLSALKLFRRKDSPRVIQPI